MYIDMHTLKKKSVSLYVHKYFPININSKLLRKLLNMFKVCAFGACVESILSYKPLMEVGCQGLNIQVK